MRNSHNAQVTHIDIRDVRHQFEHEHTRDFRDQLNSRTVWPKLLECVNSCFSNFYDEFLRSFLLNMPQLSKCGSICPNERLFKASQTSFLKDVCKSLSNCSWRQQNGHAVRCLERTCPWQIFFISLLHSTWGSDMKSEKIFPVAIFLHRVLAVWKREIWLPVGSKTASRGKLGIVGLWHVTGNTLTTN